MRKKFLLMLTLLIIALGGSGKLFAQELLVNCDYNSSTEGYGLTKFSNYTGAYTYATTNSKTSATIVIEKTNTLSGNTFDNNHKNYSKLAVVIKDGATMGNAASKWDMTYPVTVEPGGTLTCARPKTASVSYIHIKNKLIVGAKGATKKAYVNFLSDAYQDCDISIRYNGSIEVYNADFYVQDLDAQGKLTIEDSNVEVDGAFASATSTLLPTTLTNSTITINGNQISGGLSDFSGGTSNQLGNVKINNSTLTIKEGDTKVAANVTATNSTIAVNNLTVNTGKTLNLNEGSTLNAENITTAGTGSVKIDGKPAPIIDGAMYVPVSNFAALKAAVEAGKNVQLTDDITTTSAIKTEGITSVIDLYDKTLTIGAGDNKFNDESNVTIKNGNVNITGVTVKGNAIFCLDEYEKTLVSTLTFDEVNLTGEDYSSAYGVFYIGESSVLNVNGGEWNLNNDTHASGGVFKADGSGAKLNIVGLNLKAHNVRRVVTYANTTIENSTMAISGDAEGVDSEMEHGFNRSPLAISNSTITMKDMVGRGITAQNGAVTISENSNVNITNCIEATIDVRNNQTVTIDNTSTVFVDKKPTIANGCKINGDVILPPMGNDFNGYTRTDAIWGEVWGNARESFVINVLDAEGIVMGTTSLNNIGGIINGNVNVTWSLKFDAASNTDEYWTMSWTKTPTINNMPAKVELWVDGVKVSGGPVVLNGPDNINAVDAAIIDENGVIKSYTTFAKAKTGDNIAIVKTGTYTVPSGKNLTITGAVEGVVFANIGAHNMGGANVTFNNVTFNYADNSTYKGLQHSGNLVYNKCTINGQVFLYGASETFNNCTFSNTGDNYNVWTYGAKEVAFNGCTFNCDGKSVLIYTEGKDTFNNVTVTECIFNASKAVEGKAAIEMDSSLSKGINLTIDGKTTATGFGTGNVSGNSLWNNKKGNADAANNDITVTVDNTVVLKPIILALEGEGTAENPYLINNLEELVWFRDNVDKTSQDGSTQYAGKYIKLTADIDLAGINWNPIGSMSSDHGSFKGVFDGDNHIIKNLNCEQAGNGLGLFARTAGNAEIKNLKLNNVTVKSTDNSSYVGGVVGNAYASTKIENVHISGDVQISGRGYIGGIAGHGYVVMDKVSVVANEGSLITSTFWCAGGILGYAGEGSTNIMNANVEGITITSAAGGLGAIVGMAEDNNGTQPISGSNLSAKNVEIKTYVGAYGTAYENYCIGYLYGGNKTSKLTGELKVESVVLENASGNFPSEVSDAVANINGKIYFNLASAIATIGNGDVTINLLRDVTLDYNARDEYGIEGTTSVTINGNNHTLTLNQKNSDWASIGLVNGKLVLNNMTIEKTGYGDTNGAWNTHAIIFSCPLEMTNVTVNNGIAVQAGATLDNVTINEAGEYYGLWINGNGQTVTMNGGSITATNGGRGIKIADQYIDNPAQVTLNVAETKFTTAKKAAVLVSSEAGAKITAENVDITNVAADNVNFVWVDEDWAANYGNVEVTGAEVAQESIEIFVAAISKTQDETTNIIAYYKTLPAAIAAVKTGETINLFADIEATEVILLDKSLTINGNGHKVTSSATRVFRVTTSNTVVTLNGVNMVNTAVRVGTNDIRGISVDDVTGVNLTLNNCSVDFTDASACDWSYAVNVVGSNNHVVIVNGGTYEGANVINVRGARQTVEVKDATLTSLYPNNDEYYGACIYVVQNQYSSVKATGNIFNGSNAVAFNVGYTPVEESDNTDNTKRVVAKIKNTYYTSLKDAFAAVGGGAVVIELLDNATLNYGAREAYGTAETTSLTINGNGKVLTLNQTNSDWSSFGLANADAKVVFNNMTIEKTGKGDTSGAWNTHAIIFSSNVEMNEVTVNNAIAVQAGAILNNVAINEANGYYGLWINGNGQSVTMNGGSITATNGGRGIKIADQYIDAPAQVTLNVTGTVFKTAKKAAVLVSSKAGAEIAASNVNIDNVAEDKVNFVWVDEDWAANYGNVEVTGAKVAQEGLENFVAAVEKDAKVQAYYKDLHAAMVAAKAGETVVLIADVDLAGTEWEPVSFGGTFDGNGKTISNLTINKPGVSNTGFIKSLNGTVKNVTFISPTVKGGENTAVVAGRAGGSAALAENITINGTIKVETTHSGYARAAAIVGGWAYGNYKNITVDGGDKANSYIKHTGGGDGRYVAGIVGHADDVNSYVNCEVKNITISGGWLCGGIAGPGPADKLASNCSVENIDINADYSGGMFGWYYGVGTIENATIKNVTFTDGSTNNGVVGGYGHNTDATVTNLTFENVQNSDGKPLLDHVASIGDNHYFTLADAVNAADNNATISLIWKEGKAPIAMNASLYGKDVTISGTATVDWSKGFLFVGRGGEGNATLTFDGANLTSASNNASTGIHVSGREKNTSDKYDGTVVIKNSTIVLDYLINKGAMTLDNATLTVKNGFAIGGRPAKETESGVDETATIALTNGSKVVVNNHNGMGLGYEAIGVMNISSGSTFECTQDFLVTAKGTMNVNGGVVTTDVKITNNGVINVSGESTLDIASFEGKDINFLDGATIKNSTIGGNVFVAGNVTFRGANTFAMLYDYGTLTDYYGTTAPMKWTVEEGASVTLTTAARYGLGYGDNVTIIGSIDNALTARENITENDRSLFMHGLVAQESKGWNCESALTVKNAYVVIGSNNSFGNKSGNYGGTYTFNINNSVVDASRITFYEALSTTTFTIDGSDVKMGTFMTRDADSKFVLKNSKVLSTTTSNGTDEGNYNKGELTLVNSSLTYSAEFKHEAGEINLDLNSLLTAPAISGAGTINVDAADFVIGSEDVHVVKANMSDFTGTINVDNNNYVIAEITETGVVIKEKELEGEGTVDNPYELKTLTELELFRNKVNAGDNHAGKYVKLSADVILAATRSANNWEPIGTKANPFKGTFDGADYTISNLVVEGENYVGLFGYADDATIKNVTIKNANVKGVECVGVIAGNVYSTSLIDNCHVKGNIKVEGQTSVGGIVGKYYTKVSNCSVIGDGVATSYVKGTYVKSDFEGDNIGGIMGHGGENNRFTGNTVKNITISGTRKVGGVVGVTDKATQVVNCVVENVNIETTAKADYAASNKAISGHGAIVGSYTTGGTAGLVADCVVKNVNFINEDNVTVSAGPITGGARGGSDGMLLPAGVTSSNNDIYMSTITGSNNDYLMNAVAKIGNVEYYALQDAFNAGGEVTVISDINLTEGVTVAAGKVVTLDLNGKDVSYTSSVAGEDMITNNGNLTIVDSKETGKIIYNNTDATGANVTVSTISTCPGSTLVVNGGTIKNNTIKADGSSIYSYAIDILTNGNLGDVNVTINGGTVYSDYMAIRQFNNGTACKNSLTINGGYIYGAKRAVQVHMDNNAAYTTIVNGRVEAGADGYSLCFFPTTSENISVLGGEFIGNVYSGSNGFITGGTFTVDPQAFCAAGYTAKVNYDGTYTVKQTAGTLTRTLPEGWSWFSSYVDLYEGVEGDGLAVLENALGENGVQIKDNAGQAYVNYSNGRWRGSLATVSSETMYAIKTSAEHTLEITGEFYDINEYEVSLRNGWNYLSYPHYEAMPVVNALGFTPANGDAIKGKGVTAFYLNNSWLGAFSLTPGEGYMYYSNEAGKEFSYSTEETRSSVKSYVSESSEYWTVDASQYPSNMTMIATLDVEGADYEVAAFVDGEVRGSARPFYVDFLDQYIVVMTINGENVANVTFKYYDFNAGEEYDLNNVAVYSNNAILGSVNNPYALTRGTTGIGEATLSDINIYPNPTTTDREINLQATCDKVEVFNTLGVKVAEYQNVDTIDALETAGTYVIRLTLNGDVKHCRLIVR